MRACRMRALPVHWNGRTTPMTATITLPRRLAPNGTSARGRLVIVLSAIAILALSVESVYEAAVGTNKLLVIVPIAVFAGLGMFALGLVNFPNFVLATIVLRSSMDIVKPTAGNTGSAGVGTAAASGLDPAGGLAVLFILVSYLWFL